MLDVTESSFDSDVLGADVPVIVDFWAPWCAPCRLLTPILERVVASSTGVRVVKVNIDENHGLAERFNIKAVPTLIAFKGGKPSDTLVGLPTEQKIKEMLDRVRA